MGCWAADYGHKLNLTFEGIDSIICQGKELGVHVYIYTGGEPLVRKDDVIALRRKHPDCAFLCFTNATLIDEKFCQVMIEVKNFTPPSAPRASRRPPTRGEAREPTSAFGTAWTYCAHMAFHSASLPVLPAKTQASYAPRSTSTTRNRGPEQPCARQPCRTWLSTTARNTSSKRSSLPNPREHNAGPGANQKTATPHEHANSGASPSL